MCFRYFFSDNLIHNAMRNFVLLTLLFFLVLPFANANDNEKKGPQLTFEESMHDYGTVYVDDLPETKLEIKFTNTGDEPLILSNVRACCGTRVTDWPRDPIMPNEEGIIKIEFRLAPRPHRISRTVTATYNNSKKPNEIFRIRGQVTQRD